MWKTAENNQFFQKLMYLKKQFEANPESTYNVEIGHQVDLKCVAPAGMPPPRVYWLRGGQILQSDTDVLVTSEGHLLIGQARPQDTGNYTCVAENIAAKRMAPTSQIVVYEIKDTNPKCKTTSGKSSGKNRRKNGLKTAA
ncbi:unnamed protein product [Diabrotica balteata]|uniref:Ig-like domain-containing protein n=1 Tax=Diabrotica balteata TaxID=107213 RepID=A0A9N9SUI3_DIABA|nr:unnamed protein product [Diabrotica balteata]